jgi:hypothetical protein
MGAEHDKVERDNILTEPVSNPVLLSLKQEGAIIGDGVKSFVDRCFVPGTETHYGNDLHSWYQGLLQDSFTHSDVLPKIYSEVAASFAETVAAE